MPDPQKLFDVINSSDDDQVALTVIKKHLADYPAPESLCTVGFQGKQAAHATHSFGYHTQVAEPVVPGSSLFSAALSKNYPRTAAYLLQTLGMPLLLKTNDNKENGFHAVARFHDGDFKKWFLAESCAANSATITNEYKSAVNEVTAEG